MSMKWHPDKNPDADVTSMMQDINEAYAILKNKEKRHRYDQEYALFVRISPRKSIEKKIAIKPIKHKKMNGVMNMTFEMTISKMILRMQESMQDLWLRNS